MLKLLFQEIAKPLTRRLGTAASAYLVGLGVQATTVESIVLGITLAAGVGIDLMFSNKARKK